MKAQDKTAKLKTSLEPCSSVAVVPSDNGYALLTLLQTNRQMSISPTPVWELKSGWPHGSWLRKVPNPGQEKKCLKSASLKTQNPIFEKRCCQKKKLNKPKKSDLIAPKPGLGLELLHLLRGQIFEPASHRVDIFAAAAAEETFHRNPSCVDAGSCQMAAVSQTYYRAESTYVSVCLQIS